MEQPLSDNISNETEIEIKKGKCQVKRVEIKMPKVILDNYDFLEQIEEFIIDNKLESTTKNEWETLKEYREIKNIVDLYNDIKDGINLIDDGKNKTIPRIKYKLDKLKKLSVGYL